MIIHCFCVPRKISTCISDKLLIQLDELENDSLFSYNECHTSDKQSLKIPKRFDDANRKYHVLSICRFAKKLFSSILQNKKLRS